MRGFDNDPRPVAPRRRDKPARYVGQRVGAILVSMAILGVAACDSASSDDDISTVDSGSSFGFQAGDDAGTTLPTTDAGGTWVPADAGDTSTTDAGAGVDAGTCEPLQTESCTVAHGTGIKTCDYSHLWGECVASSCDWGYTSTDGACVAEQAWPLPSGTYQIESIVAYGRYWNFVIDRNYQPWPDNGSLLTSIDRYVSGPCAGHSDDGCVFESRSVRVVNGKKVEGITAYGAYYVYEVDNGYSAWPSNGTLLTAVERYAAGPCAGLTGDSCSFDTKTFVERKGSLLESITAYGRYYVFDASNAYAPWPSNGTALTDVARYASGPCAGKSGTDCHFDTFTSEWVSGQEVESITAYGKSYRYWVANSFEAWASNGEDLTAVPRYANGGPCAGRAFGTCTFDSRSVMTLTLP